MTREQLGHQPQTPMATTTEAGWANLTPRQKKALLSGLAGPGFADPVCVMLTDAWMTATRRRREGMLMRVPRVWPGVALLERVTASPIRHAVYSLLGIPPDDDPDFAAARDAWKRAPLDEQRAADLVWDLHTTYRERIIGALATLESIGWPGARDHMDFLRNDVANPLYG